MFNLSSDKAKAAAQRKAKQVQQQKKKIAQQRKKQAIAQQKKAKQIQQRQKLAKKPAKAVAQSSVPSKRSTFKLGVLEISAIAFVILSIPIVLFVLSF